MIAQPWAATGPTVLGATKWSGARADFFHGSLDDMQVWQRSLSGQDVHDLADAVVPLANYGLAEGCGPELISATSRVPSLQASWTLGQTSGNAAADSTGHGHTVAVVGGAAWVPGHDGGGLQLDGVSGYGSTSGPVANTADSFTVSAWVNPADLNADYTVLSQAGANAGNFVLRYDKAANRWAFGMASTDDTAATRTWATGKSVPQAGNWTLLTAVFDRTTSRLRLSVNGVHEADAAVPAAWTASGPLLLGAEMGGKNPFKGILDQGRVWSASLTDDQIASMNGLRYLDSVTQTTATAAGGVTLATEADGTGTPAGCAAQFDSTGTGRISGPRPANLRTEKSFTVEGWVKHTWTAADASARGPVDPETRTMISTDESQYSPFFLGYRPYKDANGRDHRAWSLIVTVPTANGSFASTEYSDVDAVDNQWTHLAATYDVSTKTIALYVNGVLQRGLFFTASGNATGVDVGASTGRLLMGSGVWTGQNTNNLKGAVAGARVYSGVRSGVDVRNDSVNDDPRLLFQS